MLERLIVCDKILLGPNFLEKCLWWVGGWCSGQSQPIINLQSQVKWRVSSLSLSKYLCLPAFGEPGFRLLDWDFNQTNCNSWHCTATPVKRDDAEVKDGGGGGEDVHRVPEITQQWTEDPALVHSLVRRRIFILNYLSISSDRELSSKDKYSL